MVALPARERAALHAVIARHGGPGGSVVRMPAGAQMRVEYTERSVRGYLREAVARDLRPRLRRRRARPHKVYDRVEKPG
jgi:hypothetical protein